MKKLRFFDSLKFVLAIVACMFILNIAHAATLPAGYTELEYLQTDGNAYIDTGILLSNTDTFEITFQSALGTLISPVMGAISGGTSYTSTNNLSVTYNTSEGVNAYSVYCDGNAGNAAYAWNGGNYADKLKHTIKYNGLNIAPTIDGVAMTQTTGNTLRENTPTVTTWLFGRNTTGAGTMSQNGIRIYDFYVYNKGHFIPARRDSDGVLGMYDLADSNPETAFHTNAGTGTFIAGEYPIKIATTKYNEESFAPVKTDLSAAVNAVEYVVSNTMTQAQAIDDIATNKQTRPDEGCTAKYCLLVEDEDGTPHWYPIAGANGVAHALPAGYTELQYIESTGTQYIDTGIGDNTSSVLAKAVAQQTQNTGASQILFGVNPGGSGGTYFGVGGAAVNWGLGATVANGMSTIPATTKATIELTFDNRGGTATINGETVSRWKEQSTSRGPLAIFAAPSNGGYYGRYKLWSCEVYQNDVLARNFVPAKNSNNVVGLYDTVSGQFFTNAGTGEFTAGPDM